ncbi:HAD family hydrolase [Actinobaculum suis]|uniref:HAD family hydrolase n=1 Tax=Actinobaculum suis TaxID=1657 RepID=UPI00066FBC8D|nr:HAD-IA family hydrolase [Actinobaculum suis]KMY22900.1 HAD family hydrolase [Actinobaculum suis]
MNPILIDLDGTLIDSAPVVTSVLQETVREELGQEHPRDYYLQFIGPPLMETFAFLGATDPVEITRRYRERYERVMLYTKPFPHMPEMVGRLARAGVPLAIATSKNERNTLRILDHYNLTKDFRVISGDPENRPNYTKADVVRDALDRLAESGVDTSSALMVGDRIHDIEGAGRWGIPTVLVGWSHAPQSEFDQAWGRADSVAELEQMLGDFAIGKLVAKL